MFAVWLEELCKGIKKLNDETFWLTVKCQPHYGKWANWNGRESVRFNGYIMVDGLTGKRID